MSTLKDYLREVRDATAEHLEARHRADDASAATHQLPREDALATIALVTIRLLEQQLSQSHEEGADLQMQLKACRRALKAHTSSSSSSPSAAHGEKRSRSEATATAASATPRDKDASSAVELGQYASTDAFNNNSEKRLKFARLMGGAKATTAASAESSGSGAQAHTHNTHAKNSAEVRRMNESLESQFEAAMSHKGKKGLGA